MTKKKRNAVLALILSFLACGARQESGKVTVEFRLAESTEFTLTI